MATEKLLLGYVPSFGSSLHLFVAANTIVVYNLHYYIKKLPPGISDRADWSVKRPKVHALLIIGGLITAGICIFFLPGKVIAISIVLGLLSLGYSLPVLPFPQKKRLKDWGLLKLFLLALVWTCVTVLMPLYYWGKHFEDYDVEFLMRFTFMLPLCIAFDIRDMETDKEQSIYTLPNAIGLKNCYRLMDGFLLLFCLLAYWQYTRYPFPDRLLCALAIALLTKLVLLFAKKVNTDVFHLLFVDGMMLAYAAMVIWL